MWAMVVVDFVLISRCDSKGKFADDFELKIMLLRGRR
jgi:hypothetical protein